MKVASTNSVGLVSFSVKLPLASVLAPCDVPGTTTVAPMSGALFSSTILPVTTDCAIADETPKSNSAVTRRK